MMISTDLNQLKIEYPAEKDLPKNLLYFPQKTQFSPTSKKIPFREQYANESRPHVIKHIHYQYGKIKRRRATMYYYKQKPLRLVYSSQTDEFAAKLMREAPPRVKFPPNTVSSPIARSLRETALKWIVERFFESLHYLTFDEPILEEVNPDCLVLPANEANKILQISGRETDHPKNLAKINFDKALFVEIKAYHQSTKVGEKEVLQTYNYANKGGKALLITTGEIDNLDTFNYLNENSNNPSDDDGRYSEDVFGEFCNQIKAKNRKYIQDLDMSQSQDSFDTRGIYYSSHKKIQRIYRYTKNWPEKIHYQLLNSPVTILEFLASEDTLGIVEPEAFKQLLISRDMEIEANLFSQIQKRYLEEITIDPTFLYPKDSYPE